MTIRTSKQAIVVAKAQDSNTPGTCQANVNIWFNAPPVGDFDHDGDADAVDGWESEPKEYKYFGDRNPPAGVPLAFHGGSHGFGHRAMTLTYPGHIKSTDMNGNTYAPSVCGTVTAPTTSEAIAIIERAMGVVYTGWSKTIGGHLIPNFTQHTVKPPVAQTRGPRVDLTLRKLRKAHAAALENHNMIKARITAAAIKSLLTIPTHDKKH